jgi:hypothetical protein
LDSFVGTAQEMGRRWELGNLSQRRAVVMAVLEKVVVQSAITGRNRFDCRRLEPVFRA